VSGIVLGPAVDTSLLGVMPRHPGAFLSLMESSGCAAKISALPYLHVCREYVAQFIIASMRFIFYQVH
jgi:hypothetical protein